jgi:hypothetical protein
MNRFVWCLSHDEVNQDLARGIGARLGLVIQVRLLKEGLPDGDCQALIVDLDSVAPDRPTLRGLVKELSGRPHDYPVVAFGYDLEEDQIRDLRAAGVHVFQHGLGQELFAAISSFRPQTPPDGLSAPSR